MDKRHNVCFSGYRLHKFPDLNQLPAIQAKLACVMQDCVQKGFHTFSVGMADGFDIMAAEEVVKLKELYPNITFVAVIPCHNWREFTPYEEHIMKQADSIIAVAEKATTKSYHRRNRYLVDTSSTLICYHDKSPGGTQYTVNYATSQGLEIINICHLLATQ